MPANTSIYLQSSNILNPKILSTQPYVIQPQKYAKKSNHSKEKNTSLTATRSRATYGHSQYFEKAAVFKIKQGVAIEGKYGILAPLFKRLVEASLQGEIYINLHEEVRIKGCKANRSNWLITRQVKIPSLMKLLIFVQQKAFKKLIDLSLEAIYARFIIIFEDCLKVK